MQINETAQPQSLSAQSGLSADAATQTSPQEAALFEQLFQVTDENRSGDVNMDEFGDLLQYSVLQEGSAANPQLVSPEAVQAVFNQVDTSADGIISQQEFNSFLGQSKAVGEELVNTGATNTGPAVQPIMPAPVAPVPVTPVETGPAEKD